jgi:hypothetical protein
MTARMGLSVREGLLLTPGMMSDLVELRNPQSRKE